MNGLSVDGVAGYDTQVLLYSATAIGSDGIMAGASVDVSVTLRRGMTGEAVRALQQRLITLGYLSGTAFTAQRPPKPSTTSRSETDSPVTAWRATKR